MDHGGVEKDYEKPGQKSVNFQVRLILVYCPIPQLTPPSPVRFFFLMQECDRNSRSFKSSGIKNSSGKRLQHQIYNICEEEEHMELEGITSATTKPSKLSLRESRKSGRTTHGDESLEPLTNDLDSNPQQMKREKLSFQVELIITVYI